MQPIVGYNYGAKHYDRVLTTYYKAAKWGVLVMLIAFIAVEYSQEQLVWHSQQTMN